MVSNMKYKQDEKKLEILHDGNLSTEVSVEYGDVTFFNSMYSDDCSLIFFSIEEWEKVKEWVDKKIGETNGNQ